MARILIQLVIISAALFTLANPSVSQCGSRVALTDSTYIRCEGVTYSNCEVELEVNQSGLWLNRTLVIPFVQFVDRLSDPGKDFYRATNVYRKAAGFGATDRQGLIAASKAEILALERLRELTAEVSSVSDLQSIKSAVLADSLVSDFVEDVIWSKAIEEIGYKSKNSDTIVFLGTLCGGSSGGGRNPRDWDEYLPYLMETFCKQVETAKRLETVQNYGNYLAVILGNSSGHAAYKSKAELLEELNKY